MPGIQILQKKNSNISIDLKQLSNITYNDSYQQSILFENNSFTVFNSSYPDYPITKIIINEVIIILEGYIYNFNQKEFIDRMSNIYQNKKILDIEIIAKELDKIDGDYLIYIINSDNNELVIINDQLKRLPLYYYENSEYFLCGRDLKFITSNIDTEINKDALIDYLLFMIPTRNETLHKNIFMLDSASILQSAQNEFKIQTYKIWNYQEHKYSKKSFEENHKTITKLLFEGMKNRVSAIKGDNINVLLSGGLDSRTIIAMLNKLNKNVNTQTFLYPDKTNLDDYEKSKEIVSLTKFIWNGYDVENINKNNIEEIINLTDAMNFAGIANMLSFLKKITKRKEQYYTGDWGRILKNDFPRERINNYDELVNYLIKFKVVFKPDMIAEILEIPEKRIFDRIKDLFSSYPEKKFKYKYLHFLYHERTQNWLQGGEERNRKYFWSATPFSNQLLYDYLKNINPKHKKSFKLYMQVINNLDARFSGISYGEIDNLNSLKYVVKDKFKLLLGFVPALKNKLKKFRKKEECYFENSQEFIELFSNAKNSKVFKNIVERKYTSSQLFTLVSLLEYLR